MSSIHRQRLRDVVISFKYLRPRIALGFFCIILLTWPWFIANPESFSTGSYHGRGASIDAFIASLPPAGRVMSCIALEAYFLFLALTYYVPCLHYGDLIVFDGKQIFGLDFWGIKRAIKLSSVQGVYFSNGSLIISSPECRLRIPISLLDLNQEQKEAIRSMLNDGAG